jgi:hypothetical protein
MHPRPRVRQKAHALATTGSPATTGIPCATVLTVSFVLFPVTGLVCHRHPAGQMPARLSASVGAPEPHDFAVRTSTARRAMTAPGDVRPSHPAPNVRDDREPPLLRVRDAKDDRSDLGSRSTATDWHDGQIGFVRDEDDAPCQVSCVIPGQRDRASAPSDRKLKWRICLSPGAVFGIKFRRYQNRARTVVGHGQHERSCTIIGSAPSSLPRTCFRRAGFV